MLFKVIEDKRETEAKPSFYCEERLLKGRLICVHVCKKTGAQTCGSNNETS